MALPQGRDGDQEPFALHNCGLLLVLRLRSHRFGEVFCPQQEAQVSKLRVNGRNPYLSLSP